MAKTKKKGSDDSDARSQASSVDPRAEDAKLRGKKKQGQKGRDAISDEDDEGGVAMGFHSLIGDLSEKRTATREGALSGLQAIIRSEVHRDELDESAIELATLVISLMKKGNAKEAVQAGELLTLMFIALQGPCQEVLDQAESALSAVVKTHKNELVRAKICQALAMGSFACGQDASDAWLVLSLIEGVMSAPTATAQLLVPALAAWALLVSSMPDSFVFERVRRLLAVLDTEGASLLEHENVDVRVAAGDAASVVYEACWRYSPAEARKVLQDMCDDDEEEHHSHEHQPAAAHHAERQEEMSDFEKFAAKVEAMGLSEAELAELDIDLDLFKHDRAPDGQEQVPSAQAAEAEASGDKPVGGLKRSGSWKSMKQGDRCKERRSLRMARAAMQGGTGPPVEKLKIRGATIEISTWRQRTWLNALRASLQAGLQAHLAGNGMLHDLFDIDSSAANMTALEMREDSLAQRHVRAKNSVTAQLRDKALDKARRQRSEMCHQAEMLDEEAYNSA